MNIIALIPASSKSKSIKDKNLYPFGGYPMLAWSVACAKMSCHIKKTYIFTDSLEYAKIALEYGADVPFLNTDPNIGNVRDTVYISQFLEKLESRTDEVFVDYKPDFIVLLRPTTPLRDVQWVDDAITGFLIKSDKASSLRSVTRMSESAYKCMEIKDGWLKGIGDHTIPRQQVPETFHPNGYVDILKVDLVRDGIGWGDRILPFITEDVGELDSPEDIEFIEWKLSKGKGRTTLERLILQQKLKYMECQT